LREDILNINKVTFEYNKGEKVLNNLDISIGLGELVVLVGPNGSGKTTLMKLIFDLLDIQEGDILIAGKKNNNIDSKKQSIYLPSDNLLPEFLTGREYINLMCDLYDCRCDYTLMNKLIEYYSMEKQVNNLIETYSHGMVKKIQLITAFLIQPELIVIDETLNGIDIEAKEISKLLMNQLVGKDKTVLMCTHDLEFAREIGSRIIIMHKGTIYQDSSKNGLDSNSTLTDIVKSILKFKDNAYEI
jgi:ABC-2 type transport system ATP-binding protein